jgi:multidrug resistance efflux pump
MDDNKKIFPADILEFTSEYHFHKYSSETTIVYRLVIAAILLAIASLFFIKVDISVKSSGVIKSPVEYNEVKSLVSGRVKSIYIKENTHVTAGQVLLTIESEIIREKDNLIQAQNSEFEPQISDLQKLIKIIKTKNWQSNPSLNSTLYKQQFLLFNQRINESKNRFEILEKKYQRNKILFDKKVISTGEFDPVKLDYLNSLNALELVYNEQASAWESDLNTLKLKVQELKNQNKQNQTEKELYTLRAPITGNIQQIKGVQIGSYLSSNDVIAEISPDSGLIAETYIFPKDIGLLKVGIPANLRIDSYNYHEWGMLKGKIISISNDVYNETQTPYFKIRCKLDSQVLTLKNGYTAKVKKGMSLEANYFISRRTLFQILYDKTDDWLNPSRISEQQKKG